jgi:Ca-activated chloride channel homolog
MFNPNAYENSRPDGFGVLEVSGDGEGGPRRFVPLRRTELRGEVTGPLAGLRLAQVFGYAASECDRVLEAVYRFPLPGDAAVTAVRVRFGDVEIRAELKERGRAEDDYREARAEGRQAALATRESPDVFTLRVAGIRPDEEVAVETAFVLMARPEGEGWSLRLPLTTAPRYVRSDEAGSRQAEGQPLGLLRDPGHRFALDVVVRGVDAVESPTHALEVSREGDSRRVRLRDGEVIPDRDCVLAWRPARELDGPTLRVFTHDDPGSGRVYFLAMAAPPATHDRGRGVPREVVLLVDHSGSMEGAKWQAADWAVERFLADLTPRDAFALGLFHTTTRWFAKRLETAEERAVGKAVAFLKANVDQGGTELGVALEQALDLGRGEGERARHALIVTDAEVSDAGRVLRLADQESRKSDRRRISVLCLDAAPNSHLAMELARRGGGVARFLTSDPEQGDIATALDDILADWGEPVLAGLRLEVDRPGAEAAGHEVSGEDTPGRTSIDLGDLPAGRPVWVVGRVPRGEGGALSFRLLAAGGREVARDRAEVPGEAPEGRALKALFGARRVLGLEYLIGAGYRGEDLREELRRLGYESVEDPSGRDGGAPKVYAENAREDAKEMLRGLLVREALDYGLASSETAFVAERSEAGRVVEGTVAVANALPSGWSGRFLAGGGGMMFAACMAPPAPASASSLMAGDPADLSSPPIPSASYRGKARGFFKAGGGAASPPRPKEPALTAVYNGAPSLSGGEAILFEGGKGPGTMPEEATIHRLAVLFPEGTPDPHKLDPGLALWIFVDDLTAPRAKVKLADLVRQRGVRPLNLRKGPGQAVRIVLVDPSGAWAAGAPRIEVALGW